jgi:anti-sigma B factor antagonist
MNFVTRNNKGTTIVDATGPVDLASSPALRKILLDSLKNAEKLAVNMAGVNYLGSSGIASLLEILKEAREVRKRFILFGITDAVREVLQLTRLTKVFEILETEDQVVNL